MPHNDSDPHQPLPTCCPCTQDMDLESSSARDLWSELAGWGAAALGGTALTGLSWSMLAADGFRFEPAPPRRPLVVKPIFTYPLTTRRFQTSWRNWGGIETQADVDAEAARIKGEIAKLQAMADFPARFLPLSLTRTVEQAKDIPDLAEADVLLVWAAGDGAGRLTADLDLLGSQGKDMIVFVRHQSGPLYYWYEGVSARYVRQCTDTAPGPVLDADVVVDRLDEVLWRLRALCGLRAAMGSRILAIGGIGGWGGHSKPAGELAKKLWKLDIRVVPYPELGKLIEAARADGAAVASARHRAEEYLKLPDTKLDTEKPFVDNAFLLEQVFRSLMKKADCRAITVGGCMRTIMPIAQTTACLALSALNDAGYLAFCESDFVVIPSGILLGSISGRPTFLNNPTYPHDGIITQAHCTAPRKMDGKSLEPARIMTHYESDYGAAPKVQMHNGQKVTNIMPDFDSQRWVGMLGEIVDHPLRPICRSQIDVKFACDSLLLAQRLHGFHWMTVYGDYLKEIGYALRRVPIRWECLG